MKLLIALGAALLLSGCMVTVQEGYYHSGYYAPYAPAPLYAPAPRAYYYNHYYVPNYRLQHPPRHHRPYHHSPRRHYRGHY